MAPHHEGQQGFLAATPGLVQLVDDQLRVAQDYQSALEVCVLLFEMFQTTHQAMPLGQIVGRFRPATYFRRVAGDLATVCDQTPGTAGHPARIDRLAGTVEVQDESFFIQHGGSALAVARRRPDFWRCGTYAPRCSP